MATSQIQGTPCKASNAYVAQTTTTAYTLENEDDAVVVTTTATVTLPSNPHHNQRHRVLSAAGVTTTVAPSGTGITIPVVGAQTVTASTFRDYEFVADATGSGGVWLSQAVA